MTGKPNFDELVGDDVEGAERDRLRRVHELLVAAGPPHELSPELEAGPDMLVTYRRRRRGGASRRPLVLAAAALVIAAAFLAGYMSAGSSKRSDDFATARTLRQRVGHDARRMAGGDRDVEQAAQDLRGRAVGHVPSSLRTCCDSRV